MEHKLRHWLELTILTSLIIINILNFLNLTPADVDVAAKIVSTLGFVYLMIKVSLSRLFFGRKDRFLDIALVIILLFFSIKTFAGITLVMGEETVVLKPVTYLITQHLQNIELYCIYIGFIGIILLSLYATLKLKVHSPSVLHIMHEEGNLTTAQKKIERFFIIFFVFTAFYIIVFNLTLEWLSMAIDNTILALLVCIYLLTMVIATLHHHYKQHLVDSTLHKIGDSAERFYEKTLSLLTERRSFLIVIAGLLVLHLISDVATFIIPYMINIHEALYFDNFSSVGHSSLLPLYFKDIAQFPGMLNLIAVSLLYLLNICAIISLLCLPAFIWYKFYKKENVIISPIILALFYMSISALILTPIFRIQQIDKNLILQGLTGVDIQTAQIAVSNLLIPILYILGAGIIIYVLSIHKKLKRIIEWLAIIGIDAFVGYYLFLYVKSMMIYYLDYSGAFMYLITHQQYLLLIIFALFFLITSVFYAAGYVTFLIESKKEIKHIH
jgi:hypothetical protein